jgi:cell fate regulator YaaT (PSP1 superfamily)
MTDSSRQPARASRGRRRRSGPSGRLPGAGPSAAHPRPGTLPSVAPADAPALPPAAGAVPDDGPGPGDITGTPTGNLVVLQFKGRRRSYYHNRRGVTLRVGDHALVEADRGRDLGRVTYVGPGRPEWWTVAHRQGVLELATAEDLEQQRRTRRDEAEFWDVCRERIRSRGLDMSLVTVERQHDGRKLTFYFTAEGRVDFRDLVRDLAAVFRTRIELRQIGVRDETRLQGGLATCGREYCCSGFLHEFVPVTLKMAKTQQLPLNPAKLSGPCGRLRCCLAFEDEHYREARRRLPRVGATVQTPDGPAVVRQTDLLRECVTVDGAVPGSRVEWPADRLRWDGGSEGAPGGTRTRGAPGCRSDECPRRGGGGA